MLMAQLDAAEESQQSMFQSFAAELQSEQQKKDAERLEREQRRNVALGDRPLPFSPASPSAGTPSSPTAVDEDSFEVRRPVGTKYKYRPRNVYLS
jgi:hypothetical protein